mmetsp:Transcript_33988/g.101513  ORF Transcript_33988/g.101513 Transcript_33988/m.101513 type:complete len:203 (-) Transcript_33988:610-1218(-)
MGPLPHVDVGRARRRRTSILHLYGGVVVLGTVRRRDGPDRHADARDRTHTEARRSVRAEGERRRNMGFDGVRVGDRQFAEISPPLRGVFQDTMRIRTADAVGRKRRIRGAGGRTGAADIQNRSGVRERRISPPRESTAGGIRSAAVRGGHGRVARRREGERSAASRISRTGEQRRSGVAGQRRSLSGGDPARRRTVRSREER